MNKHAELIKLLGGASKVAKTLDISPQAVSQWDGKIPDSRIAELAIANGRVVKSLEHLKDVTKIWHELIDQEGAA